MNILHLRASNFYGGPERQLHFHARLARKSAYKVTISSFIEAGRSPEFIEVIAADDCPTHVFQVASAYDRKTIALLREYMRETDTAMLCTHDYRSHVVGLMATRGTKLPWIAFSRGYTKDNLKVRLYHTIDKFIIRLADHIIAVSRAQKKRLQRLWISEKKITVAYNAITPEAFESVDPVNLQKKFDLPRGTTIAIAAGRFSQEKGQLYLVSAAEQALRENDALRFIFFGHGPDYDLIVDRISSLGLSDRILCPGHEKNLIGCLKGADILINPSLSEGLPNIVLEGMALGIPVVATAVGGVPEMIVDNKSGRLVPSCDADSLAQAILQTAAAPEQRSGWAQNALTVIRESFSFERQFEDITSVYARWLK